MPVRKIVRLGKLASRDAGQKENLLLLLSLPALKHLEKAQTVRNFKAPALFRRPVFNERNVIDVKLIRCIC
jgi:hypothetical protein